MRRAYTKTTNTQPVPFRSHPHRSTTQGSTGLQQVQYRSYQHDIHIYHFRPYISVADFRTFLTRERHDPKIPRDKKHGYVDTLIGLDTLATEHFVPEGDDVPEGCIEVAYLPGIFPYARRTIPSGSALGFRVGGGVVEWACFDRPVENTILNSWSWDAEASQVQFSTTADDDDASRLFDLVAYMPKGLKVRRVTGANDEHKKWHDSLWAGKLRPLDLRITWRGRVKELKDKQERGEEKIKEEEERARRDSHFKEEDLGVELAGEYV